MHQHGKGYHYRLRTIVIAMISLALSFGYKKINNAFIVLGGSVLGYLLTFI